MKHNSKARRMARAKGMTQSTLDWCSTVLEGKSGAGISKNEATSLWNFVPNSGLGKYRNCTSTSPCVVNVGGR